MITPADDYLIHQTPYTFDTVATSDRNFYDRYFFNGYSRDGAAYFAVAMGVYPNLGIIDAAVSAIIDGRTQHFVRGSRRLGSDRMDASAGPIRVSVVEPLKQLRVSIAQNPWAIHGDLVFTARSLPVEEPHFFRRGIGGVVTMDYTRMTQHGAWSGTLSVDGREFTLDDATWWGSRDHSWGIRAVGGRDPRGAPPDAVPQFFWNWAPVNFDDLCTLYTVSEFGDGTRWHQSGCVLAPYPAASVVEAAVDHDLRFAPGTRYLSGATLSLHPPGGEALSLEFEPLYHFLMKGIGYGDAKWGHGMWIGPDESAGGAYNLAEEPPLSNLHVQTVSRVRAGAREGIGVFETIVLGPHAKYGFVGLNDAAR